MSDEIYEWLKKEDKDSALLFNCLDSINASLWLLAGKQISQALILLHSSIELLFKAELDRIHPVLIAQLKLDYQLLKSLLKKEYQSHPRGKNISIPDFSVENTIGFSEAHTRVAELYPELLTKWEDNLKRMHHARNKITHAGAKESDESNCVEIISTTAYPFLDEFLKTSWDIEFDRIITPKINREIKVSKTLCETLKKNNEIIKPYILKTIGHAVLQKNVTWPRISEGLIGLDEGEEDILLGELEEKYIRKEWKDADWLKTECRICDSLSTFVKVQVLSNEQDKYLHPLAVRCPTCGLVIKEEEKHLAEVHIGNIDSSDQADFFLNYSVG